MLVWCNCPERLLPEGARTVPCPEGVFPPKNMRPSRNFRMVELTGSAHNVNMSYEILCERSTDTCRIDNWPDSKPL